MPKPAASAQSHLFHLKLRDKTVRKSFDDPLKDIVEDDINVKNVTPVHTSLPPPTMGHVSKNSKPNFKESFIVPKVIKKVEKEIKWSEIFGTSKSKKSTSFLSPNRNRSVEKVRSINSVDSAINDKINAKKENGQTLKFLDCTGFILRHQDIVNEVAEFFNRQPADKYICFDPDTEGVDFYNDFDSFDLDNEFAYTYGGKFSGNVYNRNNRDFSVLEGFRHLS